MFTWQDLEITQLGKRENICRAKRREKNLAQNNEVEGRFNAWLRPQVYCLQQRISGYKLGLDVRMATDLR